DAGAADLAERARVVRVVPELGREVEGDRQAGLATLEQVAVARIRLLRRREPGVLADRPRTPSVHVGIRSAREGELAGRLELAGRVLGRVDRLHVDPGLRAALVGRGHARIVRRTPASPAQGIR